MLVAPSKERNIIDAKLSLLEGIPAEAVDRGDLSYYPWMLCMLSFPFKKQKGAEYTRQLGKYELSILTPSKRSIPYGAYPRGILSYLAKQVVIQKNQQQDDPRVVRIGGSLTEAVEKITGVQHTSGGENSPRAILQRQLLSLVSSNIVFTSGTEDSDELLIRNLNMSKLYGQRTLWMPQLIGKGKPAATPKKDVSILLDDDFYHDLVNHAVPIDEAIMRLLWPSCLEMDIYTWLTFRANDPRLYGGKPFPLSWKHITDQFGFNYKDKSLGVFRQRFRRAFTVLRQCYDRNDPDCVKLNEVGDTLWLEVKRPSIARQVPTSIDRSRVSLAGISANTSKPGRSRKPKVDQLPLL